MPVATQSRIGRPQERAAGHSAADTGGLGLSGLVMEDKSAYVTSDYLDPAINTTIPAMQPSQLMVWSPWQLSHCLTETTLSACSWPVANRDRGLAGTVGSPRIAGVAGGFRCDLCSPAAKQAASDRGT